MKFKFIAAVLLFFLVEEPEVSMLGIKINDVSNVLEKVKLQIVATDSATTELPYGENDKDTLKVPISLIKYRTSDGNDFSVTSVGKRVVYMENDWLRDSSGTQPLISHFQFGKTSLRDIRKTFKTNGFTYTEHAAFKAETEIIEFNCFEIEHSDAIFSVVTTCPLTTDVTESTIADSLKLGAVILGDKSYLDGIWGKEKAYDPNYKKIKF